MGIFRRHRADVISAASAPTEARSLEVSISSPAAAFLLGGYGGLNYSGEPVSEFTAFSLSAVWRASLLISQTCASVPMETVWDVDGDGDVEIVKSFLDNPAGPDDVTPFEWKETVFLHLLLHGEAFLLHRVNGVGALVGLQPIHPYAVTVEYAPGMPEGKIFKLMVRAPFAQPSNENGSFWGVQGYTEQITVTANELTHVVGPRTDGLRGMGVLKYAANSIGMGLAAEKAAANMFNNGALIPGYWSPAQGEDLSIADAEAIANDLRGQLYGAGKAGEIPLINRVITFNPMAMTNEQAQFFESRNFQIEEIARWFGVPPFLLMQLDKSTSWGTGIAEQNKNLIQYVLNPLTMRLSERLTRLVRGEQRTVRFDFAQLEAGSAKDQADLTLALVNGGAITLNEGRIRMGLAPIAGGDTLRVPSGVMLQDQLEASADKTAAEAQVVETDAATDPAAPADPALPAPTEE